MTLTELSVQYAGNAEVLHRRILELYRREQAAEDPEERYRLHCRVKELRPLWQEARELAALTAHYYDRSYHKDEKYTY